MLYYITSSPLILAVVISLVSFAVVPLLLVKERLLHKISIFLIALAAAILLGAAFFHILPEVMEEDIDPKWLLLILIGFSAFYIGEKILHLHHNPTPQKDSVLTEDKDHTPKELGQLAIVADFVHNFIDGVILGAAFLTNPTLGLTTAVAIALHEMPQEIALFGVLIYAGFSKLKAVLLNYLDQTGIILGVGMVISFRDSIESFIPHILLFAIGSFTYLGATDFVPEFKKQIGLRKSMLLFSTFLIGVIFMWVIAVLE